MADFHRTAGRSDEIAQFGRFDRVALNARENFSQSADQVGTSVSRPVFDRLAASHRGMAEPAAEMRRRTCGPWRPV